ncbi:MAG: PAS domain S-box protein [Salinigranum sp.]
MVSIPDTQSATFEEPIRVLHVDADSDFAESTAEYLERTDERFEVLTGSSAADGLDRLSEEAVDCVVSDYDVPGTDGLSFLEDVREAHGDLPFVLFTGEGSEAIASEAISAGVTDYLRKERGTDQYAVLANRISKAVEKRREERDLRRREERQEALLERSSDSITVVDESGRVSYSSPSVARILGSDPTELIGETVLEYVFPDDRERVVQTFEEVLAAPDRTHTVEYRLRDGEGSWRWIEAAIDNQLDNPAVEGIVFDQRDVTRYREYERELERANQLLEAVFDASPVAILMYDRDEIVRMWNPAAERMFGWTAEETIGEWLPMVPEDRVHEVREIHDRVFDGESLTGVELRRQTKSGEEIDVSLSTAPMYDADGEIIGTVAIGQDITERKEREKTLEEMRQRIELALSETDSIIWDWDVRADEFDRHGPIEQVYGSVVDGPGASMEDFYRTVHPEDRQRVEAAIEAAVATGERYRAEYRVQSDEGIRWFRTQAEVYTDGDGEPVRLIGLATDVTELKRRERELARQSERLEEFADVVSHDLRNPLAVAAGHLELARANPDGDHFDVVASALDRMDRIVENTLTLARHGRIVTDTERVDVADLARRCWATLDAAGADLRADGAPTVEADPDRLHQLLANLFRNAIDHAGPDVTVRVEAIDGGFAVSDDGPGIPEAERNRVFEAGYSTREDGTGLGLAIVKRIAEAHSWEIYVTDAEEGNRIEITDVDVVE